MKHGMNSASTSYLEEMYDRIIADHCLFSERKRHHPDSIPELYNKTNIIFHIYLEYDINLPWEVSDLFFYIEEFTDMNYTDAWTVIMTYGPILRELRDKYEREVLKIKK